MVEGSERGLHGLLADSIWHQIHMHVLTVWSYDPAELASEEAPTVNYV